MEADKILVGIRAEDKSYWERRTPVPPHDCEIIMKKHPKIQFIVQPSTKRIFTNQQYREVGCIVQEDLTKCVLIVCIKEIPLDKYIPGMTYLHWSHTIKAQPQNMEALDKMIELKIRHLDYEKIYNEKGVNITAFPYAGIAGIITFFNEFGKLLLKKNLNTPFLQVGPTYQYYEKKDAYKALRETGEAIVNRGMPKELGLPLIIGVLGSTGLCGKGSMEALSNLPITIIKPSEMKGLVQDKDNLKHRFTIYVVPFKTTDLVRLTEDYDQEFTTKQYYEHPQLFTSVFHSKFLPYLSAIIVDIYWDCKFPRYVTNTQMRELVEGGKSRLQAICDVTCDLQGSIQFLKKYTTPDDPVYYYEPVNETVHDTFDPKNPDNIMYMAIDFLPSQLPYDASMDFGEALQEIIPQIAYSNPNKPLEECGLPQYLQDAVITSHGELQAKFRYISHLRAMNEKLKEAHNFQPKKALKKVPSYLSLKLSGHLFDTGAINKMLDVLSAGCKFNLVGIEVGQSVNDGSTMQLQLYSKNQGELMDELAKIHEMAEQLNIKVDMD